MRRARAPPTVAEMDGVLRAHEGLCLLLIRVLLRLAVAVEDWRGGFRKRAVRLRGSLRKVLRRLLRDRGVRAPHPGGRPSWNRTPREIEEQIVRLHVDAPQLGAGQLQRLAYRVLGFRSARETIRKILIRNQDLIGEMEEEQRRVPRRIEVSRPKRLWGMDLTLVWILGLIPVWLLGVVDYHGSRLVVLEALRWPTAASVAEAVDRAMASHGAPERVLTDRGSVFRAERFEALLCAHGVAHTLARPCHPWTNGRIERLFRTFKETVRACFWLVRSRSELERICRDFIEFYNGHRPHGSHGGRTPDEVHTGRPLQAGHLGRISFFEGRLAWWRFT